MTKLFAVTVTMTFVMAEDDERSAEINAAAYAKEHLSDSPDPLNLVEVEEIKTKSDVPGGWLGAIPYGDESDGVALVKDYLKPSA